MASNCIRYYTFFTTESSTFVNRLTYTYSSRYPGTPVNSFVNRWIQNNLLRAATGRVRDLCLLCVIGYFEDHVTDASLPGRPSTTVTRMRPTHVCDFQRNQRHVRKRRALTSCRASDGPRLPDQPPTGRTRSPRVKKPARAFRTRSLLSPKSVFCFYFRSPFRFHRVVGFHDGRFFRTRLVDCD